MAPLGLDALVDEVLTIVRDSGTSVHEAAGVVHDRYFDATEPRRTLAARGLREYAHDRLGRIRGGSDQEPDVRGRFQWGRPAGKDAVDDILRSLPLEGADGRMKSLIDFGLDDVRAFRVIAEAQAEGWRRRVAFTSLYEALLTRHKAATGASLPAGDLTRLRQSAQEAWR